LGEPNRHASTCIKQELLIACFDQCAGSEIYLVEAVDFRCRGGWRGTSPVHSLPVQLWARRLLWRSAWAALQVLPVTGAAQGALRKSLAAPRRVRPGWSRSRYG